MKVLIPFFVYLFLSSYHIAFAQVSRVTSVTLLISENGVPVKGKTVIVTYRSESREESVTATTDGFGRVPINFGRRIIDPKTGLAVPRNYTVTVPNMMVNDPVHVFGRNSTEVVHVKRDANFDAVIKRQGAKISKLRGEIVFLKAALKKAKETGDSKTVKDLQVKLTEIEKEYQMLKEDYDKVQIELNDTKQQLTDRDARIVELEQRITELEQTVVRLDMAVSEISCQKFIPKESLTIRFKLSYRENIITRSIDSLKKEEITLKLIVSESQPNGLPVPVIALGGQSYITKSVMYPTGDFIEVTFTVAENEQKSFTDKKQYTISLSDMADQRKSIDQTFEIRDTKECIATSKDASSANIVGFGSSSCSRITVQIWDRNPDDDVVSLINQTTGEQVINRLLLTEKRNSYDFDLKSGNNQIELIGNEPGTFAYEVSAKASFYCQNQPRPILFKDTDGKDIGAILSLSNRVRMNGKNLINEIKKSVIITYNP